MHAPGLSFVGGWGLFSLSLSLVEKGGGLGKGGWESFYLGGGGTSGEKKKTSEREEREEK